MSSFNNELKIVRGDSDFGDSFAAEKIYDFDEDPNQYKRSESTQRKLQIRQTAKKLAKNLENEQMEAKSLLE